MEAICFSESLVDTQRTTRRYISACHLLSCWFLPQLIFPILKMEAICFSETLVDRQRTTRRYIPEDGTLLESELSVNELRLKFELFS
jgi:hypothetical protein